MASRRHNPITHITPPPRRHPANAQYPVTPFPFAPYPFPPGQAAPVPTHVAPPPPQPQPSPYIPTSPVSPFGFAAGGSSSETASDAPSHPTHLSVFMPPVDMRAFAHLGYAYVDPEATSPGPIILAALYEQIPAGMEAVPVAGPEGSHLVVFRSTSSREFAANESPFSVGEHSVYFERHEEAPNRSRVAHSGFAALSLVGFPMEHWCRPHIQASVSGFGNPMEIANITLSGCHFIFVLVVCKFVNEGDIPAELEVTNSDGVVTTVDVRRVRQWPLFGGVAPPPPFGPGGGGSGGGGGGGGGGPGGPRGGGPGGPPGGAPGGSRGGGGGPFGGSGLLE